MNLPLHRLEVGRASTDLALKQAWSVARLTAVGILAWGLAGCGSVRPIKYYEVSYPAKSSMSENAINTALMVRTFEASHLYLDDKIVYGFDSPEMGTYEYQRWAEPPVEILQNALVRGLRASGRFRAVYTLRADAEGRFILAGHLYDFKEVDSSSTVARLSYEVRLRDRQLHLTVWNYTYTHDEPASAKTVSAFVEAMDKNVQRSVQEVQAGLEEYFRTHPAQ
jgi:ABC-type uncharacterized transport system auxiliary subunit